MSSFHNLGSFLMLGIFVTVCDGSCYYSSDSFYYYCETTYTYWGTGSIAGSAVGSIFSLSILIALCVCCCRRRPHVSHSYPRPTMTTISSNGTSQNFPGYSVAAPDYPPPYATDQPGNGGVYPGGSQPAARDYAGGYTNPTYAEIHGKQPTAGYP